jgi:hypothetical protein
MMIMQTKLIAGSNRLTFGQRQLLHAQRPDLSFPAAQPIDEFLPGNVSSLEILNRSYHGLVCFSPDRLTYDLADQLRAFQPNDGYHATGLQFITDNLDLVIINNEARFFSFSAEDDPADHAERPVVRPFENSRTAYIRLSADPLWPLNSSHHISLRLTPFLFRPAAVHFLARLAQNGEIPRFNNNYQEIRSRCAEIIWLKYVEFLLAGGGLFHSTNTDYFIRFNLREQARVSQQQIADYNNLLGLAEDNLELFPFKPDFSFRVQRFFSQPRRPRPAGNAHP